MTKVQQNFGKLRKEVLVVLENMEKNIIVGAASVVTASATSILLYRYLASKQVDNVYETQKFVSEYLDLHYGKEEETMPYDFGPKNALDFPLRCAQECIKFAEDVVPDIALDIGCAVGRSTFELSKKFSKVVGIDYSQAFIDCSNKLKKYGELPYSVTTEGSLVSQRVAEVDADIDRTRVSFQRGDACNLPSDLGQFGCVLASNLLCRLPNPYKFLDRLPSLVAPEGILVITGPYTWMEKFTPKSLWLGGYTDDKGQPVTGFEKMKSYLGPNFELVHDKNMPFLIRETDRENLWTVSHMTIWKRRKTI